MAKSNAVEAVDEKNTAMAVYDYGEDVGAGYENQTGADTQIPFISLLQQLSPEVDPESSQYVEGAKAGMFYDKATGELIDGKEGFSFLAAHTEHIYTEWVPRAQGGGFVGRHSIDSDVVAKARARANGSFGSWKTDANNDLIDTFYVFGLRLTKDGDPVESVIAMTSTKIKVYRAWMTRSRTLKIKMPDGRRVTPPMWATRWRITSVSETNNQNQKYFNFKVGYDGNNAESCRLAPSDDHYQHARAFRDLAKAGTVKADESTMSAGGGHEHTEMGNGHMAGGVSDEPPF